MAIVTRVLVLLSLIAGPLAAGGLRQELVSLAQKSGVRIVLDKKICGPVPDVPDGGLPIDRLRAIAGAAGLTVVQAEPVKGRPVLVVVPGAPPAPEGPPPRCARPRHGPLPVADAGPRPDVLIDAMVVGVQPAVVAELRAIGNQLPPVPGARDEGCRYLDGLGPGVAALSFDRVDPRLNVRLPWGEVGLCQPGAFAIRSRQKVTVRPGTPVQIALDATVLRGPVPDATREAVVKEALELLPEPLPDGRVCLRMILARGVSLPLSVDGSVARGGGVGVTVEVPDGGEILVTGLGSRVTACQPVEPVDPLEPYRRPRLGDRNRPCADAPPVLPEELVVRVAIRVARGAD